jgi:hypothetical protein
LTPPAAYAIIYNRKRPCPEKRGGLDHNVAIPDHCQSEINTCMKILEIIAEHSLEDIDKPAEVPVVNRRIPLRHRQQNPDKLLARSKKPLTSLEK